jgi:hypothetical protein
MSTAILKEAARTAGKVSGGKVSASKRLDGNFLHAPSVTRASSAVIGTLVGFRDDGRVPLVLFPGQSGSSALAAVAVVDVHESHIGCQVVLLFEAGNPCRPIIMGLLRQERARTLPEQPGTVQVDADGERMTVTAQEQLVLRCGKASVTLTKAGKIIVEGSYISNRSSGVLRIKGGSVQMN